MKKQNTIIVLILILLSLSFASTVTDNNKLIDKIESADISISKLVDRLKSKYNIYYYKDYSKKLDSLSGATRQAADNDLDQIDELKSDKIKYAESIKENNANNYSTTEKTQLLAMSSEAINNGMNVLDYKSIVIYDTNLKLNAPMLIIDGRTLIPIRSISESLNFNVGWESETKTVSINSNGKLIELSIGNKQAKVNGKAYTLDVEPSIYFDRTYVPLRFVSEALDKEVNWNDTLRMIFIK